MPSRDKPGRTFAAVEEAAMRRLVVALVAALVVLGLILGLTGCGGGATATPSTSTPAAAPVAVGGSSSTLPAIVNRSANETDTFIAFPTGDDVPADLKQKITVNKQPTLIYFFDSTQNSSKEVRTIIDAVRANNRGLVDLVAYDIGKYVNAAADGSVSVSDKLSQDATAAAAVRFARDPAIDVRFTPYIVLTDGQGYIIYKHSGLVDQEFLEREVLRASR
jgi:hypothetical protein